MQKNEDRIQFGRMDAEYLLLENNVFDLAICALGLMYLPDPRKALAEMRRMLKPGGRALATVWGQRANCGWAEIFGIVDQHVSSEVCPLFFNLGNPGVLELNFKAAGFSAVSVQRLSATLFLPRCTGGAGAAFDGGPIALAYINSATM